MIKPITSNEINYVLEGANRDTLLEFDHLLEWKVLPAGTDIYDILVGLGVFSSRSQAKKNWQGPTELTSNQYNWFERVGKNRWSIVVKA